MDNSFLPDTSPSPSSPNGESLDPSLEQPPVSRAKKMVSILGWIGLTLGLLLFFTWMKLPNDRIKSYLTGIIHQQLAPYGVTYTAEKTDLSFFMGLTYTLEKVKVNLPPPSLPIEIDKIAVSPSLTSLVLGKIHAKSTIWQGKGQLSASVSQKGPLLAAEVQAESFDIGSLGILPATAGLHASASFTGSAKIHGDFTAPNTLDADIDMQFTGGVVSPQNLYGFSIPKLTISRGVIKAKAEQGKAVIEALELGQKTTGSAAADDLIGSLSGNMILGKSWPASTVDLKTEFALSENIKHAFVLLDALLGSGRRPDGSYGFTLSGPLRGINASALK